MLHNSIMNLNQKFDKFNETVTSKITTIERNYEELNSKIDDIVSKRRNNEMQNIDPVARTKDWAQLKPEILDAIKQDAQPAVF